MAMARIRFNGRTLPLPASRIARIALGVFFILGGLIGFMPILGFWMLPLGLLILSLDLPTVRRWRRQATVRVGAWVKRRYPHFWKKYIGNGAPPHGSGHSA